MKDWVSVFFYAIGLLVLIMLFAVAATVFLSLLAIFVVYWALGFKISVTKRGRKLGYIRWTTFHPTTGKAK